jgi:HEAT repeat-containing protein 5
MAESQPNPHTTAADSSYPELDVQKLHALPSEQQDLYLLTFTADLARNVAAFDAAGASAHQVYVKKQLLKVINLPSPTPTRVIRNNIGRCFAGIFEKGDRKLLFETINDLASIINAAKSEKEQVTKHAAVHCLGAVYEAAGDSAINLSALATTSLLRSLKPSQNTAGLRGSIFRALGRIYIGIGSSADESLARDVWKQARSAAASDKSLFVQAKACFCLEQLVSKTPFFLNSNDFEKLQTALLKTIDSLSSPVRHAAASCLGRALVKSYSENPTTEAVPRIKKPKKSKKSMKGEDEEDETERAESPAPKSSTLLSFTLPDLLRQLSGPYCRPSTSNRARAGLAVAYIKVLRGLGESVVETKYGEIARHLCVDLMSYPSITLNRYRLLITRRFVRTILEDIVGNEILGESAQLRAAKYLINEVLKDYPQALKERPEPTKQTLTAALSALASLIRSLGSAVGSLAESCREALLQVLMHPSYTVQVHTAHCMRAFVVACPQQLLPSVTICMNSVNRELSLLSGPRQSPRRCVGYANGLAAVLSTSIYQPLYGSVDVYSRVLSQATTLLKSSGSSDLRISSTQLQVAWVLLGGLMSLGPNFVKIHLSQLLLLWKNALPKPLNKDNMSSRNILELSFLAHVRECALGAMLTFLEYNSRLLTLDVTKRLAAMLHNTVLFLNSLPSRKTTDDIQQRLSPALQLHDYDTMVRRRVFQCYTKLIADGPQGSNEALLQSNFLPLAITCFADPENYGLGSLSASIASSAGTFESIWDVGDNYGFGVTGLVTGFDVEPLHGVHDRSHKHHWISKRGIEAHIDQVVR